MSAQKGTEQNRPVGVPIDPDGKALEHNACFSIWRLKGLTEDSLRFAQSIDYTLKHLGAAYIIILGISRTSKTPTSFYLSYNHGLKISNIPVS